MKSFYSNLLSGAFLLSTVVLSSPAQAGGGSPNWAEDAITTVAAQRHQVQAKDLNEPIPFKMKRMLIDMGAIPDYESEINVETLWKTTPEFIREFTNKFQERLNVKALLRFSNINEEAPVLETLLKVGKRYRDSNISDTLQNILALKANPRGNHSHLFLNFANLSGLDLTSANLTSANLQEAMLIETNLTGAQLTDAQFQEANLTGAILSGANLSGANLTVAKLTGANLTGANLTRTQMTGAKLKEANLTDANLIEASLTDANLKKATLTRANLTGAIITSKEKANYASRGAIVGQ